MKDKKPYPHGEESYPLNDDGEILVKVPQVAADGVITGQVALRRLFENCIDLVNRMPKDIAIVRDPMPPIEEIGGVDDTGNKVEAGSEPHVEMLREDAIESWRNNQGSGHQWATPPEEDVHSIMQISCMKVAALQIFADALFLGPKDLFSTMMHLLDQNAPGVVHRAAIDMKDLKMAHRMGMLEGISPPTVEHLEGGEPFDVEDNEPD